MTGNHKDKGLCLCASLHPCVPLCTPMYPCVHTPVYCMHTPVYSTSVYPCVQVPLCTPVYPCVLLCTPCTPVYPCVPLCILCTPVYLCVRTPVKNPLQVPPPIFKLRRDPARDASANLRRLLSSSDRLREREGFSHFFIFFFALCFYFGALGHSQRWYRRSTSKKPPK
jgi:hypothetical protein